MIRTENDTNLSENAIKAFEKLYYKKDPTSEHRFLENKPEQVFQRVAKFISTGVDGEEVWEQRFFDMMNDDYFRPCTPCLMNVGVQENPQTAACFVSGMRDDLLSILDMDREAALIFASGSGIGANFGVLREKGALLSTGGQSSGPFAFIRKLAGTGEAVKSGGVSRRAAILIMFFDHHPDLFEFIALKNKDDQLSLRSMNLSVAISNDFMKAVERDADWDLIGVVDKKVKSTHKARDIFDKIASNAHKTGDPGVWFIDRNNEDNGLITEFGRIISTNPCFSEDTCIPTEKGAFPIKSLVGKTVTIFDGDTWIETDSFRKTGEKQELLRINIGNGTIDSHLDVTPYHNMYLEGISAPIKAKDIKTNDLLSSIFVKGAFVNSVEKLPGLHNVYCCTIPSTNKILTETGIITGNCGEQGLLSRNCCALASINLAKFISTKTKEFDYSKFEEIIKYGTYFLDFMIEKSGYPSKDYEWMAKQTRPIGLGIMGLADMLCLLDIPYDSQEAYDLCDKISNILTKVSIETSIELAEKYGCFPAFEKNRKGIRKLCQKFGVPLDASDELRNSNWTTIAPTGTISISCDCSPGMEPLFGITYTKNLADSAEKWIFVNPVFEKKYKDASWYKEAIEKIELNHGSCQGITCVPEEVQRVWRVAHDIHWKDRIEMQAALQSNISNAISSTINCSESTTVDEIKAIYTLAWKKGLKGITVYRDGSLDSQPVEFTKKTEICEKEHTPKEFVRSKVLNGKSYCVVTGHGKVYLSINTDADGNVVEIFPNGAKGGGVSSSMMEAIGRLSSLALQKGVHIEAVAKALLGISDGRIVWDKLSEDDKKATRINSVPDAVAQVLYRFYVNVKDENIAIVPTENVTNLLCPDCGGPAVFKEGCTFCPSCGSHCG